jgi:hypothetical protein
MNFLTKCIYKSRFCNFLLVIARNDYGGEPACSAQHHSEYIAGRGFRQRRRRFWKKKFRYLFGSFAHVLSIVAQVMCIFVPVIKQEPAAEDEDEEEDEVVQEVWPSPALAEVYSDPNGAGIEKPVQVPFGPLTAAKWNQLAIAVGIMECKYVFLTTCLISTLRLYCLRMQPLFADASDPAALAQEESGAMLLLQFPTQIKLNSSTVETTKQADTGGVIKVGCSHPHHAHVSILPTYRRDGYF